MGTIEILVIVLSSLFVVFILSCYIYRKIKHQPTGECGCCVSTKKKHYSKLVDQYNKTYDKNIKQKREM